MAIYQPGQVTPDLRSGLGLGVIDATQPMTVSWRIQGASALTKYSITIYLNDANSTQKYTTGQLTTGCPAYGTTSDGKPQFFSYTIPAATLSSSGITNGNEYKIIIQQWWSENESVTQSSASVFVTRLRPTLSINTIGTAGVISTRYYTFQGTYYQAQGDVLNWFRWQIARADHTDSPFFDSGNISGTMNIACYYDGFLADTSYSVRLTAQTEHGVNVDTGWVNFSVNYAMPTVNGEIDAGCVGGTDAVEINWTGIGYIPGVASGNYSINNGLITIPSGTTITWNQTSGGAMSFAAPWSIIWKGTLSNQNATIFTVGQTGGNVSLTYTASSQTLTLKKGSSTLVSQAGIGNLPTVTVVLTNNKLYIRAQYTTGGLLPTATLYPSNSLYPSVSSIVTTNTYTLSPSYTQNAVTSFVMSGYQVSDYFEVVNGTASASVITRAITNGNYSPSLTDDEYMETEWTSGLNAGTLTVEGDLIIGYALYRQDEGSDTLVKIAETDTETELVYDYSALSQQGPYTYYLFPMGSSTYISAPFLSGKVMPCWWNYTLMECEETSINNVFTVLTAFRFKYNVETGAISNNNSPTLLQNFTQYPKIQIAPQNYKSATLSGLIGAIDWSSGQPEYIDTIEWRDMIYALSTTKNPLFLKTRKGELIRVKISGPISMQTGDKMREQPFTMTLPWVEVGSTNGVSLYSLTFKGVQEEEGVFKAQNYVDTSNATATPAKMRLDTTAYNEQGKFVGDAQFTVDGTTLVAP